MNLYFNDIAVKEISSFKRISMLIKRGWRRIMIIINELDSTCGISDEELTRRFKESIRIDNEIRKIKGLPIARYDDETKRAYLEYPNGKREYVGG